MVSVGALVFGVIAGMRSMLAPAFVSWAAWLGILPVAHTPMAFMGYKFTHLIFTLLAIGELVADKLPSTPSRKAAGPFATRVVSGALCGATIGASIQTVPVPCILGALGAVAGTLGGATARNRAATLFRRDFPAALLEDTVAILLGAGLLFVLR